MLKKITVCLFLFCAVARVSFAGDVAEKMPMKKTAVFVQVTPEKGLAQLPAYLSAIDPENGVATIAKSAESFALFRQLGATYGFEPVIMDKLTSAKYYFVVLGGEKFDVAESNGFFSPAVLMDIDEESAKDFIVQYKGLLDTLKQKRPDKIADFTYEETEINGCPVIEQDGNYIAGVGPYLVFSDKTCDELIALLLSDAAEGKTVKNSSLFQRYEGTNDGKSAARFVVNLSDLIALGESVLQKRLDMARAQAAAADDMNNQNTPFSPVAQAQNALKGFDFAKKVFGIERLNSLGGDYAIECSPTGALVDARMGMDLEAPIADAMKSMLDGGETLQPPLPLGEDELAVMFRLGLQDVFTSVMQNLDAQQAQSLMGMMMLMKMQTGADLNDILPKLGGDFYVYCKTKMGMVKNTVWDEEAGDFVDKEVAAPTFGVKTFIGLKDGDAAEALISGVQTTLGAIPDMAQKFAKRSVDGKDVYVIGKDAAVESTMPDGKTCFALARAGRYLVLGSWEDVTGFLASPADIKVDPIFSSKLQENPNANFLACIPAEFAAMLKQMAENVNSEREEKFESALARLDVFSLEQPEVTGKLEATLRELFTAFTELEKNLNKQVFDLILVGKLQGNLYEVSCNQDIPVQK